MRYRHSVTQGQFPESAWDVAVAWAAQNFTEPCASSQGRRAVWCWASYPTALYEAALHVLFLQEFSWTTNTMWTIKDRGKEGCRHGSVVRTLTGLPEDLSSVPNTDIRRLPATCKSNSRRSNTLFWSLWIPTCLAFTHMHNIKITRTERWHSN